MKEIFKKHSISIFALVSIIALALPLCSVTAESECADISQTVNGFSALKHTFLGIFLIVGPIVLIAMNYLKQLEKHKSILAVAVPIVCIVCIILAFIQIKSSVMSADGGFDVEVTSSIGIGGILALLSYIATAVAGAVTYHNLTLDKIGLKKS